MKDLSFNEHLPLIDDVIALVLVAGVTKTGQHLSAFRFPQQSSVGIVSMPVSRYSSYAFFMAFLSPETNSGNKIADRHMVCCQVGSSS